MISYARLTDRLDSGTAFSAEQILLPNAASWLLMAASSVPLAWALRKRVGTSAGMLLIQWRQTALYPPSVRPTSHQDFCIGV